MNRVLTTLAAAALAATAGCGSRKAPPAPLGAKVQVGPLLYTVHEVDWVDELPGETSTRLPERKFAIARLQVQNTGNREVHVPLLKMISAQGQSFIEQDDGKGVEEWWGIMRTVNPGETVTRRILFDVVPGDYSLQLTDGGDPDSETTRLVHVPFRMREGNPVTPLPSTDATGEQQP